MMRKAFLFAAMAVSLITAACHTVAGAGQDVSAVGNAVTDTAHDVTPR
jgi:predicted small secreted protein